MESRQAAQAFNATFMRVYDRFHRRVKPSAYRPSPETLAVLRHLSRTGPLTVTEAAKHFTRSQAAMSEIIARLETRKLLERAPDERDRRRTLVWLTDEGQRVLRESSEVLSVRLLTMAMDQLDDQAKDRITKSLEELLNTAPTEEGWDHD